MLTTSSGDNPLVSMRSSACEKRAMRRSRRRASAPGRASIGRTSPALCVRRASSTSSRASKKTSVPARSTRSKESSRSSAPPPSATTTRAFSHAAATARASRSRNPRSPSRSKMSLIGMPVSATISASVSTNSHPRRWARSGATVDFPLPERPHRKMLSGPDRGVPRIETLHDFLDGVAAELLQDRLCEYERQQRLANDGGGRYGTNVAALHMRFRGFARAQIDGLERFHQRREGLHRGAHDDGLARRHPAVYAARAICAIACLHERARIAVRRIKGVVCGGTGARGQFEAEPDLDAFDRIEGEKRAPDFGFEPAVPLR